MISGVATPQCTAVDTSGDEVTFNPSTSSTNNYGVTPVDSSPNRHLTSVSCPSQAECVAVDQGGNEVIFNPENPTTPIVTAAYVTIDAGHALNAVSCPSLTQCTAVDAAGGVVTFDPDDDHGSAPSDVWNGHDGAERAGLPDHHPVHDGQHDRPGGRRSIRPPPACRHRRRRRSPAPTRWKRSLATTRRSARPRTPRATHLTESRRRWTTPRRRSARTPRSRAIS